MTNIVKSTGKRDNKKYTERTRLDAVALSVELGSRTQVARALKINIYTLRDWERTQWWRDAYDQIKEQENRMLSARLQKIVAKTADMVDERLEYGDWYLDQKTGEIKRKPLSARDAHHIMMTSLEKKQEIDKPKIEVTEVEDVMTKLASLAKSFADIASKKKKTIDIEDATYVEDMSSEGETYSIHAEREEGLQTGESLVQLEAGTEEESIGTDNSTQPS